MIVEPVTTDPELIKLFLSINDAVRAYDAVTELLLPFRAYDAVMAYDDVSA